MEDHGLATYDDVARWLGQDVRLTIEITRPCLAGGLHYWEHRSIDVSSMDSAFTRIANHWHCRDCGTYTSTDPAAISGRWGR